jgi:hypothetical protein
MSFVEARQALLREFVFCVDRGNVPPLSEYLADYVKSGCTIEPGEYRLLALTPAVARFANTASDCLTDCMLELQSKYRQFVPDDWGGHFDKGSRDIGVVGFNILEGVVLDIQEINQTAAYVEWAAPKLDALQWERLLIRAVVDFGHFCRARQVRLQPPFASIAEAGGFVYDQELNCFVLNLEPR